MGYQKISGPSGAVSGRDQTDGTKNKGKAECLTWSPTKRAQSNKFPDLEKQHHT